FTDGCDDRAAARARAAAGVCRLHQDIGGTQVTPKLCRPPLQCICPLLAQSVLSEMSAYLSAFGAKQTWAAARSRSSPPLLTQSGHRRFQIPQRSRLLALWCAIVWGWQHSSAAPSDSERFRSNPRTF